MDTVERFELNSMNSPASNKRSFQRKSYRMPVILDPGVQMVEPETDTRFQGMGFDISDNGLGVLSERAFRPGAILRVLLKFKETDTSLPVLSEVRWARLENNQHRLGLQFLG